MKNLNRLLCSTIICTGITSTQAIYADPHSSQNNLITPSMLTLNNDAEKCTVSSNNNESPELSITLLLDAPCYWVTTQDTSTSTPQSYGYPEKKIDAVMLIAGDGLNWTDDKKTYNKLPLNTQCSQSLQGVIISDNEIYAVGTLMEAPHCKGLAVDEKVFLQAAESEVKYKTDPSSASSLENTTQEVNNQETKIEQKEDNSLLGSIQKTIKRLFTSDD